MQFQVTKLEDDLDAQHQYLRRPNLRIHGTPEPAGDENTDATCIVLDVVSSKIKFRSNISIDDIAASHRVGPEPLQAQSQTAADEGGNRRSNLLPGQLLSGSQMFGSITLGIRVTPKSRTTTLVQPIRST